MSRAFVVLPEHIEIDREGEFILPAPVDRGSHLFIVRHDPEKDVYELHIAPEKHHAYIVARHSLLREEIVGGGTAFLVDDGAMCVLYITGRSNDFGPIPPDERLAMVQMLRPIVEKRGMRVDSVSS